MKQKMKKLFNKIKESKVFRTVIDLAADSLPFGTTAKNIIGNLWTDVNSDGRVQFGEVRWDLIAGLIGMAILLRFDVITVEGLSDAANIILKIMGG